jgi:hypothetical protein
MQLYDVPGAHTLGLMEPLRGGDKERVVSRGVIVVSRINGLLLIDGNAPEGKTLVHHRIIDVGGGQRRGVVRDKVAWGIR